MKKLLILCFVVLAFAACGNEAGNQPESLAMPTIEGKIYDFSAASQSRPVLIASVAGFCGYCKMMIPLLDNLAGEYKGKNVDFVIAFVDNKLSAVQDIAKKLEIKHATVVYNGGNFASYMDVEGFPAIYLINNTGGEFIVEEWGGYNPNYIAEMRAMIDSMLK